MVKRYHVTGWSYVVLRSRSCRMLFYRLVLGTNVTNNLREAFFRARCGTGALNIGQFSIRDRADRLDLEHLPYHCQCGRDTASAAKRIESRNVEINVGLGAYTGNYLSKLLRTIANIGYIMGVQCRVSIGSGDGAGIKYGHSRFRKLRTHSR